MFVVPHQRIKYEAIAISTEMMGMMHQTIYDIARNCFDRDPEQFRFTGPERRTLIAMAWGIVDQADMVRQIVYTERNHIDMATAREFMSEAATAQNLRNWMDHLPGRLKQYLDMKKPMPPPHGALSFAAVRPEDAAVAGENQCSYRTVVVLGASRQRDLSIEGVPVSYERINVPLDHFVLQAFDQRLSLTKIVTLATAFCHALSTELEIQLRTEAERLARESGDSVESHMKPSEMLDDTVLIMTASVNQPEVAGSESGPKRSREALGLRYEI